MVRLAKRQKKGENKKKWKHNSDC